MRPFLLLLAGLVLLGGVPLPAIPWTVPPIVAPSAPATGAVYVYEKDESPVPVGVTVALNRLNREQRIAATLLEADTTNGTGVVPAQFKPALDAAKAAGLPCLVVVAGSTVLRVVPAPATEAAVMEAVP